MSLISLFSLSPKGSRSTKALLSILGGSLTGAARGGICGGGLELCWLPGIRLEDGGKMLVWKGFPRVEFWVQDPLQTGAVVWFQDGSCWLGGAPKAPEPLPQLGTGEVEKAGGWAKDWVTLLVQGKMEERGWLQGAAPGVEAEVEGPRDSPPRIRGSIVKQILCF